MIDQLINILERVGSNKNIWEFVALTSQFPFTPPYIHDTAFVPIKPLIMSKIRLIEDFPL